MMRRPSLDAAEQSNAGGCCDHGDIHLRQGTAEFELFIASAELERGENLQHGALHLDNLLSFDPSIAAQCQHIKGASVEPARNFLAGICGAGRLKRASGSAIFPRSIDICLLRSAMFFGTYCVRMSSYLRQGRTF